MMTNGVTAQMSVDEVMRRWPPAIRVFLRSGMKCVGCPIAGLHSIDEACREHAVDPSGFVQALRHAT